MTITNAFQFPKKENLNIFKKFYEEVNGAASFDEVKQWQSDTWVAEVQCSRSTVLEKAGVAMIEMTGAMVEGMPADLSLLQTLAWPANPCMPAYIIMASASRMEGQDVMVTFYTDLIIQDGAPHQDDKDAFATALRAVCGRHGQSLEEYQSFLTGRGMLAGCAAECGILYFFEEKDVALLADIMQEALRAYRQIIDSGASRRPTEHDYSAMQDNRKKIVDWMLTEDYGVKVARQNNMPIEVIESYGFPPIKP